MAKDIQQQKDFYDSYWKGLRPLSAYKVERTKWIADILLKVRKEVAAEHARLLDLGCGDGRLVPFWQAITGAESYGLELSPQAVEAAQQLYPGIRYTEGDATQTTYESNTFDIIICQEVLEHIENQQQLVAECARILKAGGRLILTTPNKLYFDNRNGGNYSKQPIEKIVAKADLYRVLTPYFEVLSYETLVYAKGDSGSYRFLTNGYWLALLRRMGAERAWKRYLLKKGYGLHMAVVCRPR